MKKKIAALFLASIMVATTLAGCSSGESTGEGSGGDVEQVIVHNIGDNPKTIDPCESGESVGIQVIRTIGEGLTRTGDDEKAIPGLAESWDVSEDGLVYTFHLRDAVWSDDVPLTADDFVYTWRRTVSPEMASGMAYQFYYIKNAKAVNAGEMPVEELGVKAIDDKTFEVTLETPTPFFLELVSLTYFFPVRQDIVEANPDSTWMFEAETNPSIGPFKLVEWRQSDAIIVEKNDKYYDADAVKLDRIEYVMLPDSATAYAAFEAGEIDYTEKIPSEQIVKLQEEEDPNFQIAPYIGTYFISFNTTKEPFNDERVRKAFSLAIDRNTIVNNVTKGGEKPASHGFCSPGLALSTGADFAETFGETIYSDTANVEEAQKLLAEAGYPNGEGFPAVEYLFNTDDRNKAIAEALQEMWKQNLNIDVTLRNEELGVYYQTRDEGQFDIARGSWIGDYADPMTFLDMWVTGTGMNSAKWSNAEYDQLIKDSQYATGEERDKIFLDAQAILEEEEPIASIYYYTNPMLKRSTIKNAHKASTGSMIYREAYVEAAEE